MFPKAQTRARPKAEASMAREQSFLAVCPSPTYTLIPVLFAEDADFGFFFFGVYDDGEVSEVVDELF
jgi:hypothetical protein